MTLHVPAVLLTMAALSVLALHAAGAEAGMGWHASGRRGAVAAGGERAAQAGLDMLAAGGNATDAAVTTILAMTVTDFGPFCIGGEVPMLIYDAKSKKVVVLDGQGRAPLDPKATEWFLAQGIPTTRSSKNIKSACVPAVIDLCATALAECGTKKFSDAVAPTLALLDAGGKGWYADLARTLRKLVEAEGKHPRSRAKGLQAVRDRFYRGDIADELDRWYRAKGAFLRKADLAAHATRIEKPVSVAYRGYTVHKCDAWTQGPALCQTLRLLEGLDLKAMGAASAKFFHVVTEATKLALADRDHYYADPLFENVPLAALLSKKYADLRRPLIDLRKASLEIRPGDPVAGKAVIPPDPRRGTKPAPRDTTTCVVADRWGNVVAATPSGWGSKAGPGGKTGITHGTRMISLNTWPGHPNCVAPGKRPRITLTPTLVTRRGKPLLAISVAGGDLQDQTTLYLLLQYVEFGTGPAEAVAAPRAATGHHIGSFSQTPPKLGSLTICWAAKEVREELVRRGHKLNTSSKGVGTPVMLTLDPKTGLIRAAGDPSRNRHAAALD